MKCPICGIRGLICQCGRTKYIDEIERLKPFEDSNKEARKFMKDNFSRKEPDYSIWLFSVSNGELRFQGLMAKLYKILEVKQ